MMIDIRDAWVRPSMMWARFSSSGISAMSGLHMCVELSFDPSGILMEIVLIASCKFLTGVPGRKKCLFAPASSMASFLVIYIIDVEYVVSICLLVQFLMIFLSLSSLVASSVSMLMVLCVVVYNELKVFGSRLFI